MTIIGENASHFAPGIAFLGIRQKIEWTKDRIGENTYSVTNFNERTNPSEHLYEGSDQYYDPSINNSV